MGGNTRFWFFFGGIWLAVGVCFIAATPGVNLFADPAMIKPDVPLWLFALLGIVFTSAGTAIIWFARAAAARDRRLMHSGVLLTATVIDIRRSLIAINRQTLWHVRYRYEYAKGRPLDGNSASCRARRSVSSSPGTRYRSRPIRSGPKRACFSA